MSAIEKLAALCHGWGGELVLMPSRVFQQTPRVQRHPHGHHAIDWYKRRVFVDELFANPGAICHEMAHVFVDDTPPSWVTSEWDWLGWEIALARLVGCYRVWSAQNATYIFGDGETEWGASGTRRRAVATERIETARNYGYLDKAMRPICVRSAP